LSDYIKLHCNKNNIELEQKKTNIFTQIKIHSFARALNNIISNATKYSTKIKISVYSQNDNAFITVEDNGKGIDNTERNHVLSLFIEGTRPEPSKIQRM
jgi:signal transduction histidine kinase